MTIRVALHHETRYDYDRLVGLSPQIVRLRPAPHCRTPICSYSLRIAPDKHFINWQQDAYGNFLARLTFPEKVKHMHVQVDLVAEMTVINPFDFFLEPYATEYPFTYDPLEKFDLGPYLSVLKGGDKFEHYLAGVDRRPRRTIDFLVDLNQRLSQDIRYVIRMEPGIQSAEETLTLRSGSCRDTSWLLVQLLRRLGLAARFASGYLIQLKADEKPLDGPAGAEADFTDLHAWAEVYLPGAGWVGLDPTSGLLAGEGHIPLACTPNPQSAAPVSGSSEQCETEFSFAMSVRRVHEDPRVTKPYTADQWQQIQELGHVVDRHLQQHDVRLTMGGEPTFISVNDYESPEWRTEALGPTKERLGDQLLWRLKNRFSQGALLHHGQGKWYPGEPLPRWAHRCYWRKDGQPIWLDSQLFARKDKRYNYTTVDSERFARRLAERLGIDPNYAIPAYEDGLYYTWKERRLPVNVDLRDNKLEDPTERQRLARVFEQGITRPVGHVLPLQYRWWAQPPAWCSGPWVVRSEEMFLIPGDSPLGLRLPLAAIQWEPKAVRDSVGYFDRDPLAALPELPSRNQLLAQLINPPAVSNAQSWQAPTRQYRGSLVTAATPAGAGLVADASYPWPATQRPGTASDSPTGGRYAGNGNGADYGYGPGVRPEERSAEPTPPPRSADPLHEPASEWSTVSGSPGGNPYYFGSSSDPIVRTALCVEPRQGALHVFLPPSDRLEPFLALIAAIEETAAELDTPIFIEGYLPPTDARLQHLSVTPDPGVIEVNVHPAHSWDELMSITSGVYEDARNTRLATEKFDVDGTHTGTGGGNHIVLGGPTPADSPFLRRPDVLRSLIGYWHNHPSLSYLFSSRFIGPTSQAPRMDEGRHDATYEMKIAFQQIPTWGTCPPWLVDRIFRHLLVDGTGNTHRAEFCIDKLFSPDSSSGRLGLVEFRAFEMPPHYQMSLAQQLLLRTLIARFWERPYTTELVNWGTALHDRFMLPHFVELDFEDVIQETRRAGFMVEHEWFAPHFEFRFPKIGEFTQRGVQIELRQALEPWYVLGEENYGSGTTRFVDSSVERLQVRAQSFVDPRYVVTCNGRTVPLHPTGRVGEYVAGVRYRAWQPPSCLHPTIPVDEPLVFDLVDTWMGKSMGGCRYHVGHPGGLNPSSFPINANEAESRRVARFFKIGHTPGTIEPRSPDRNLDFPLTLDLRFGRNRQD